MKLKTDNLVENLSQSSVSDIAFLLMIFFILTTAWSAPHILRVSSSISSQNVKASEISDIRITSNGVILDGMSISEDSLPVKLNPDRKYRILSDDDACYGDIIKVLDILQEHNIMRVQVVTDET